MKETLSQKREAQRVATDKEVLAAVEFELIGSVAHAGGILTGLSVKFSAFDCLLTLRAEFGSNRMVGFIGAPDLSSAFRKAVTDGYHDRIKWREDTYAEK